MNDTNKDNELHDLWNQFFNGESKLKRLYALWYEFLDRTDPETWSDDVKRDFSGVLTQTFDYWFGQNYFRLFFEDGPMIGPDAIDFVAQLPVRSYVANTDNSTVSWETDVSNINWDTHFVLVVERGHPHSEIMSNIEWNVRICTDDEEGEKRKVGRKEWKKSKALYPFATRPDHDALMLTLLIHDIDHEHEHDEEWTHWKTGEEVKQRISKFSDEVKLAIPMNFLPLMKYGKTGPDADQKILLTAAVIRILERAEKIKAGVVQGIFPAV
jgi:hypothetical protein